METVMAMIDPLDDGDSLEAIFNSAASAEPRQAVNRAPADFVPAIERAHTERCPRCGGSGTYGRFGRCFKCNGTGRLTFKTAPETRARNRAATAARKARSAEESLEAFKAEHPEVFAWLTAANRPGFDFPAKMLEALARFGSLTEGQMAAVRKLMARDTERKAERAARVASAPEITVERIEQAFAAAKASGLKRTVLRLDTF